MRMWTVLLVFSGLAAAQVPHSRHVWIVTEENHSYENVVGSSSMPFYNNVGAVKQKITTVLPPRAAPPTPRG